MNRTIFTIGSLALVLVMAGCSHSGGEPAAATPEKSAEAESRVKHGTNGEVIITLDAATQKVMGLQVAPLAATELSPEVKGFGRVLDPAPLSVLVADLVSARTTAATSQKERARLKVLAEQNNASARTLDAAEATAQRDAAQADAARAKLMAGSGKAIADRADLQVFTQSLLAGASALVRIDLPAGEELPADPPGARLVTLADAGKVVQANFVGTASGVDPLTQGRGFWFVVETNTTGLAPNTVVTGYLQTSGTALAGVTVPRSAVVRFNGTAWVYLQAGDETFERTEVALDRPLDGGWFVATGLKTDAKVVTVGAQQLLSEELKGQGGGD